MVVLYLTVVLVRDHVGPLIPTNELVFQMMLQLTWTAKQVSILFPCKQPYKINSGAMNITIDSCLFDHETYAMHLLYVKRHSNTLLYKF